MFSGTTRYAIRAILYLSSNGNEIRTTVDELSKVLDLPKPYLSKLMQQLSKNGIISSSKGRGGGFYLTDENLKRPLMDVIECFEGKNTLKSCILGLPNCSDSNPCRLHSYYKEFRSDMERILINESLKDLVNDSGLSKNIAH